MRSCPFCGQSEHLKVLDFHDLNPAVPGGVACAVKCDAPTGGCGAQGPGEADEDSAEASWNTRKGEAQ